MSISVEALVAPTQDTLEQWLNTPRLARCGEFFTPSEPMWNPDESAANKVNWQAAIVSVPTDWQRWLHAALAYRMADVAQATVATTASLFSRAAQAGFEPLNTDHLIDLRERFPPSDFSNLVGFMSFWQSCESLEYRPSHNLSNSYSDLPRKKQSNKDPVLSLDPEKGPFTQTEQDALYQWLHEQFCHHNLDPERYLYMRLLMVYGLRGVQLRMMIFDDFMKVQHGCKIRLFWAKQKNDDAGFREKSEIYNLDEDLYNTGVFQASCHH